MLRTWKLDSLPPESLNQVRWQHAAAPSSGCSPSFPLMRPTWERLVPRILARMHSTTLVCRKLRCCGLSATAACWNYNKSTVEGALIERARMGEVRLNACLSVQLANPCSTRELTGAAHNEVFQAWCFTEPRALFEIRVIWSLLDFFWGSEVAKKPGRKSRKKLSYAPSACLFYA